MFITDLGPKDAADLLVSSRAELSTLWNIFIVVVLGLVSLAYSQKGPADRRLRAALMVAFGVFAIGNLYSVLTVHSFSLSLVAELRDASFSGRLAKTFVGLQVSPVWRVAAYHILLDVVVVAALWVKRGPRAEPPGHIAAKGAA
jgi:hypothetical protein